MVPRPFLAIAGLSTAPCRERAGRPLATARACQIATVQVRRACAQVATQVALPKAATQVCEAYSPALATTLTSELQTEDRGYVWATTTGINVVILGGKSSAT